LQKYLLQIKISQRPKFAKNEFQKDPMADKDRYLKPSVADPDPYVFGPPGSGSGSISQRYGSRSGSFYHQAKKGRKTLIPAVL
jgi:hypothetical protein